MAAIGGVLAAFGLAAAAGLNAYIPLLMVTLTARFTDWFKLGPPAGDPPPIWWGISPHHMAFPGTISLRLETYHALIRDVCTSIARHGFTRIMILNGRGGNASPLAAIAQELSATGLFVAVWPPTLS